MAAFSFTVNGTTDGAFPALGLPSGPTSVLAVKTV